MRDDWKRILLMLFVVVVCAWILAVSGCATYRKQWRKDGDCFARCQNDLGRAWWGGSYSDDSRYCICVVHRDERMWTLLTPKDEADVVGMKMPVFPYHMPNSMRQCRDRTTMMCGEF
jgi:hypothetical protein